MASNSVGCLTPIIVLPTFNRPGCEPEQVVNPERLVGEGPVAGFALELADIWAGL